MIINNYLYSLNGERYDYLCITQRWEKYPKIQEKETLKTAQESNATIATLIKPHEEPLDVGRNPKNTATHLREREGGGMHSIPTFPNV